MWTTSLFYESQGKLQHVPDSASISLNTICMPSVFLLNYRPGQLIINRMSSFDILLGCSFLWGVFPGDEETKRVC